ncbi:MAG: undecaprenyl-diphosphate phosphatase [Thermoanaerobaculum sp.]|nr:undecaprenyl-diphosphate phosphatase [Thermoanaerobaculum sp.]MCX7895313.1 undecaprenyl-diphosphate phosphatase [Thermoanaerobaculum sp.]MDW7968415.1 undecaprenyl-diphosphate phosphatase [Thermoanaerobaculum sp.]
MSTVVAVMLGVLQGLTEFLPVSSSGHLALAQMLIPGFSQPGLLLDLALHVGTMVSVVALEWSRLAEALRKRYAGKLAGLLVIGTGATALVAFPLRPWAEAAFSQSLWIATGLAVSGLLLLLSRRFAPGEETPPSWRQAVVVGLAQGLAVFPGLSRSGTTISVALAAGMGRRWSADFSFLLSLPAVAGAALVEVVRQREALAAEGPSLVVPCLLGGLAAALAGLLAITLVRRLLHVGRFALFAWYLFPLCGVVVVGKFLGWWP